MWYEKNYRRHLCDMHIEDWDDEFLSEFSPEVYFENLKTAKVQSAMIYFQSHVGLCYYPTKSGKIHKSFVGREDSVKRLVDMCRNNGISVTGYYSLIYNNRAYTEYPQWRMVPGKGEYAYGETSVPAGDNSFASNVIVRTGLCCPNNLGYRGFVSEQIKEMSEYFTVDGMFYDMLFWPQMCRCEHCKARFKAETGYTLPEDEDWNDPIWLLSMEKRREWMGEFAQFVTDESKRMFGNISVEHNTAFAVLPGKNSLAEGVLNACDYAGGDLYGGIYHQSFTCKFYRNATKNQPFEFMPSRCEPNLSMHTVTKSEDTLLSEVFLTAAHHGASLVIDAVNPNGTMDKRFYERIGRVFEAEIPYEKYFNGDMVEDVGVYYSMRSKFNAHGEKYTNHAGCVNSVKLMIEKNIPCGVCGRLNDIQNYKVIIASLLTEEDREDYRELIDYVEGGGNLYISGGDCKGLIKEFFGGEILKRTEESIVYIAPIRGGEHETAFGWFNEDYPLQFAGCAPVVEGIDRECIVANITLPHTPQNVVKFVSIHSSPPGVKTDVPAMACKRFGKGKVLWSALPIEAVDNTYQYGEVFIDVLRKVFGFEQSVVSDAPKDVEIVAFRDNNEMTVSSVLLCTDLKARTVEPFEVCVKTAKMPKSLIQLPNETECKVEYENGVLKYKIENLNMFDMKKIIF